MDLDTPGNEAKIDITLSHEFEASFRHVVNTMIDFHLFVYTIK
jgi:hypothetical protein